MAIMQCSIFIYIWWSSTVHYLAFSEWFLFPGTVLSDFELYIRMAQKQMKQYKWTCSGRSENKRFGNVFPGLIVLIPLYWRTLISKKYQLNSFQLKSVVKINNKRKQLTNFEQVSSTVRVASFNFFIQIWTT